MPINDYQVNSYGERYVDSTYGTTTTYDKTYVVDDMYYMSVEAALKGAGEVIRTLKYELGLIKSEVAALRTSDGILLAENQESKKSAGVALAHSVGCNPEHLQNVVKEFWDTLVSHDPAKMVEHMEYVVRKHEEAI